MTTHSKYFYPAAKHLRCDEVIHIGKNCWESTIWNFTGTILSCVKFVLPLALIPIIMKIRNLNKDVFMQSFRIFVDFFFGAWLVSGLGLSSICLFRRICGVFYYYTVLAVPAGLGAFISSWIISERAKHHYAHGLSTVAFQVSITRGDFYIFKLLRNSRLAITIAFMALNATLMHGLRENHTGRFYWLTQPLKSKTEYHEFYEESAVMDKISPIVRSQIKCCAHEDSCDTFIFNGIKKFFKFGVGLEIARHLIYNYSRILRNPLIIFNVFFKQLNWNLVLFLVGYVGVYRFIYCWRSRRNIYLCEETSKKDNQLASLMSGLVFYLYPDQSIFSHTVITIIEIYWTHYYEQIKTFLKWIPLEKINMIHVVFPLVFGYVTHIRTFYPYLAPAIQKKLMHLSTNYKDAAIFTAYHKFLFGLTPQFLL
ncbi:uncharacterized protein LOC116338535 [Contarinia nasturtii]|uniref:uncharacterized protein LOC116338535 n=1 Tax=Contarinia nasturtii TaxID=265458 RepID=UPI0012D4B087|nr:uncharacterized protein LOC116338535 [Contarinia nasturtii]XP_031619735.1 uncharacterized protein LOC116338535 [Contarinia nasturtii]